MRWLLSLKKFQFQLGFLFLVCVLVYSNTLTHEFVWDDHSFILSDDRIATYTVADVFRGAQPEYHTGVYRPVRNVMYILAYYLWAENPLAYHGHALVLHIIITLLVFGLIFRLTKSKSISLIASLIHAVHPIHVHSVSWITASFDLWAIVFGLVGIHFYLQALEGNRHSRLYWRYSYLAVALAIFAYEMALMLPIIVAIHAGLFQIKFSRPANFWQKNRDLIHKLSGYGIIITVYFLVRTYYIPELARMPLLTQNWSEYTKLIISLAGRYLALFILPVNLSLNHYFYDQIPSLLYLDWGSSRLLPLINWWHKEFIIYTSLHLGFIGLAFYSWRQRFFLITWGILWMYLALMPVLQLIPQPIIFAEYYAYLASIGWVLVVAGLIQGLKARTKRFTPILANYKLFSLLSISIYVLALAAYTYHHNHIWRSDQTVWSSILDQTPTSASALNGLGAYKGRHNDLQTAIDYYYQAVERNPEVLVYQRNLVSALEQTNQHAQVIPVYLEILEDYPTATNIYRQLALAYLQLDQPDEALTAYQSLYQLAPDPQLADTINHLQTQIGTTSDSTNQ